MNFLELSKSGVTKPTAYYLTIVCVLLAYIVLGQLPMLVHVLLSDGGAEVFSNGSYSVIQEFLGSNTFFVYLLLPFAFALIVLLCCVKFIHKRTIKSVFTLRDRFDWRRYFVSLSVFGAILILFFLVDGFGNSLIHWNFKSPSFWWLLLISTLLIPLQTACEDVLFRGYLLQGIGGATNSPLLSIAVTGLMFGLLHGSNPEVQVLGPLSIFYYVLTGCFLSLLVFWDDGLELSMGYHAINNWFAAVVVTNNWQAFQTDALFMDKTPPSFGIENFVTLLIVQPILLFIFYKVYNWKKPFDRLFNK